MSRRNKIAIGAAVVLVGAGVAFYNMMATGSDRPAVDVERIVRRNLEALVSASGTIQPKLSVDISSSVMGRVTRLDVNEGDEVETGQFLMQIDPESARVCDRSWRGGAGSIRIRAGASAGRRRDRSRQSRALARQPAATAGALGAAAGLTGDLRSGRDRARAA